MSNQEYNIYGLESLSALKDHYPNYFVFNNPRLITKPLSSLYMYHMQSCHSYCNFALNSMLSTVKMTCGTAWSIFVAFQDKRLKGECGMISALFMQMVTLGTYIYI